MKRTISKLLAIAGIALGITGICSTAANAYPSPPPYAPAPCTFESSSASYPYRFTGSPTTTGWYVYCGAEKTKFQTPQDRTGKNLLNLPTSGSSIRQKFQAADYVVYVFKDYQQAQTIAGTSLPAVALNAGVAGFHQGLVIAGGNIKTPFIGMYEKVRLPTGTYPNNLQAYPNASDPNGNLLYNYDSGLYHETGHAIDDLSGTISNGSGSSTYQTFITGDTDWFDGIDGCRTNGWESSLWGSVNTTICDGAGNYRTTPVNYAAKTNLTIVREFSADIPSWQQYFTKVPSTQQYREIYAEQMQIQRNTGNNGPAYVSRDAWITYIYWCGNQFINSRYATWQKQTSCLPVRRAYTGAARPH